MTREEIIAARRVAFEAWLEWLNQRRPDLTFTGYSHYYSEPCVDNAWKVWNAALDSLVIELPPKISEHNKTSGGLVYPEAASYDEAIDDCREQIESQGIKVKQ